MVRGYHQSSAGALYLHVPFCARKCAYCDFASWATREGDPLVAGYERALEAQVERVAELGLLDGCETAYVGGGTPTLLGGEVLPRLISRVREAAPGVGELTCEANPDSLTDGLIPALRDAGATRLSIGVQSTSDRELSALGRIHSSDEAEGRVRAAVESGLDVSCDLMCATPLQTDASWARSLSDVVSWGVGHVSVYPLAIEPGTAMGVRYADEDPAWNDPSVQADRMEQARSYLEGQGLSRYEVASYARPGKACRHNEAYWTGVPYLGLGTGASGMLAREGYERLRGACPQLPKVGSDISRVRLTVTNDRRSIADDPSLASLHFDLELLDLRQAVAEDLMLGMRLVAGVPAGLLGLAREVLGSSEVDGALERVVSRGLATLTQEGRLVPTHDGWLLGNELYGELWGLAGRPVREASV